MSKDDYPVTYRMLILKDGVVLKLGFANGIHDELVMSMAEAETLGAQITAAAKHRRKAQGVLGEVAGEKAAREAEAAKCRGFRWIGQSFATCDGCGRPAWEHEGEMRLKAGAGPFGGDEIWELRPWKPGEAEAIRRKWDR